MPKVNRLLHLHGAMLLILISYAFFAGYLWFVNFDFMRADVAGYWQDSLVWHAPFHEFHVPGYPFMIALLHAATFQLLPPAPLMMLINVISLAGASYFPIRAILSTLILPCGTRRGSRQVRLALLRYLQQGCVMGCRLRA